MVWGFSEIPLCACEHVCPSVYMCFLCFLFWFFFDISRGFVLSHSDLFDSIYFIILLKIIISYKSVFSKERQKGVDPETRSGEKLE